MKLNDIRFIAIAILVLVGFQQCNTKEAKKEEGNSEISSNKTLEKANRYLIRKEYEDIENYIRRHQLEVNETGSGLRYVILEEGKGPKAEKGRTAVLNYKLSLLTGDVIYSSDEAGQKIFEIGNGNVESGLEEAMTFLQEGDKVKLVVPSHLAYGLLGDNNKIPPRCTLVYDIEVVDIK
jgi:FKBP-type peptidyl-prolyl cis-trans isomerase